MATQRKNTRKSTPKAFSNPVTPTEIAKAITGAIGGDEAQRGKMVRRRLRAMLSDPQEKRMKAQDHNKGDRWTVPADVANELVAASVSRNS